MKNYWRMKDFSIFPVPYAYVDHSSNQANQLFVQNKVRIKFKMVLFLDRVPLYFLLDINYAPHVIDFG